MKVDTNVWGIVIILDPSDIKQLKANAQGVITTLTGAGGLLAAVLAAAHIAAGVVGVILGLIGAAITAELAAIYAVDKGDGVYVTIPWFTLFLGPVAVPTTAPPFTPPPGANWTSNPNGVFGTDDRADRISYAITRGASAVLGMIEVELQLDPQSSGWQKVITTPILTPIPVSGRGGVGRGFFPPIPSPTAALTFSKAKELGHQVQVLQLQGVNNLAMNDKVSFTWVTD